ncbi:MAG: MotE family protein [Syntrophales bacterium]
MKKLIILCEILVVVFFVVKFLALGGVIKKLETATGVSPWSIGHALAESPLRVFQGTVQDVDEQLLNEKKLLSSLTERQMQLESRESALKSEEKRLESLRKEIVEKIERLKGLEDKLNVGLETASQMDEKKFKDLAKVYEAAPPNQVATILERMDTKTAAGILMNMNTKKAGPIWGFINPAKSVEIAKEITTSQNAK